MAFDPSGQSLAVSERGGVVKFWGLVTGTVRIGLPTPAVDRAASQVLCFSPTGRAMVLAAGNRVLVWRAEHPDGGPDGVPRLGPPAPSAK